MKQILQAAAGLAVYLRGVDAEVAARGVVVGYDSRDTSPALALDAALTLCAAGVRVYLWGQMTTTPLVSFAVRELQAAAGLMVTDGHHAPAHGGCKLLWEDGAQVDPERAAAIAEVIRAVGEMRQGAPLTAAEARARGLLLSVTSALPRRYRERLLGLAERFRGQVRQRRIGQRAAGGSLTLRRRCRVLYTPLSGAAALIGRQVLTDAGFRVAATATATATAESAAQGKPDLILSTDPEGERLEAMVWAGASYRRLSGNQVGALLTDYLLTTLEQHQRLPRAGVVIKSVASTNLVAALCREHRVGLMETEVGFRHIGARIRELEQHGTQEFLFGFEESGGYLAATFLREPDGVMAALLLADAAAYHKARGRSLWQALHAIWRRCGYYLERQSTWPLPGPAGRDRIAAILARLTGEAPPLLGGIPVAVREEGAQQIRFRFADGGFAMVRSSGAEPTLKAYCSVRGDTYVEAEQKLAAVVADLRRRMGVET